MDSALREIALRLCDGATSYDTWNLERQDRKQIARPLVQSILRVEITRDQLFFRLCWQSVRL